jgi:hypothetical protein
MWYVPLYVSMIMKDLWLSLDMQTMLYCRRKKEFRGNKLYFTYNHMLRSNGNVSYLVGLNMRQAELISQLTPALFAATTDIFGSAESSALQIG